MADGRTKDGFSLVEALVATGIVVVVTTLAVGGLMYLLRTQARSAVQSELDLDVQKAMERLKRDLRLSALDRMFFYPASSPAFTAVSFPMARDDDGDGAVEVDGDGRIVWDRTVVYHVWVGEPTQLRRTVFDPRDNGLSDAERQQQVDSVVVRGHGRDAPNGQHAATEVVFENLFEWAITPRGALFDGYAPAPGRAEHVSLGSCVVSNGAQAFSFRVTGKNPLSSGYLVGLDTVSGTPCHAPREAEDLLPAVQAGGALPVREEMPGGSWSGNHQLTFPAAAPGDFFVLHVDNDRWEETNFRTTGAQFERTTAEYDSTLSPRDFVLKLEGMTNTWTAADQAGTTNAAAGAAGAFRGAAVRVLLRGQDLAEGNWIRHDGARCRVAFAAAPGAAGDLVVEGAWIGLCAGDETPSMDFAPGTRRALAFSGSPSRTIAPGTEAWSDLADLPIARTNSYLVSFLVSGDAGRDRCLVWDDVRAPSTPSSYVLAAGAHPGPSDAMAETWSTRGDVTAVSAVIGVSTVFCTHPAGGTYTSRILATRQAAPRYAGLTWDALLPAGAALAFRVRSGDQPDLSDAPAWSNVTAVTSAASLAALPQKPYLQFRAELTASAGGAATPRVRDVTLSWDGAVRVIDAGGTFARGPGHGIFELLVNGRKPQTGLLVDLEIFRDVSGLHGRTPQRITSLLSAEVMPRNTGR